MCTFRRDKINLKRTISITDKNKYVFKSILIISIFLILMSILNSGWTSPYGLSIGQWYARSGLLWKDKFFEAYVPFLTSIIISTGFYRDYESNIYEIMTYYNKGKYNISVFIRWALYTVLMLITTFIAIIIQYIACLESPISILILVARFFPPVLFMSSLSLAITVIFKNPLLASIVTTIYVILDVFSTGRLFKIFTLMGNSFVLSTPSAFYINRFTLVMFSIIFAYVTSKKSIEV